MTAFSDSYQGPKDVGKSFTSDDDVLNRLELLLTIFLYNSFIEDLHAEKQYVKKIKNNQNQPIRYSTLFDRHYDFTLNFINTFN